MSSNRDIYRAMGGGKNLASPFNEGFSFTPAEWEMLAHTNPELFDEDPQRQTAAWKRWALTSGGRHFRIR